jgi:hypothetical protein
MKIKFLSVLFALFMLGVNSNVLAQEEEGGDFWSEEESAPKQKKEAPKKAAKETGSPALKPVENSCSNRNELREEVRLLIRPFKYNLAKTTTITYKRYPQLVRVLIPIYSVEEHRIIFSTKGLPQEVIIRVYDKPKGEKRRKTLFTSDPSEPISTYELPKEYKESYLFVEYSIPATEQEDRNVTQRGCVVMMMGYLYLPEDSDEGTVDTDGKKKRK